MKHPADDTAKSMLEAWLADEARVRAAHEHGAGPGVAMHARLADMDGMAVMRGVLDGTLPSAPIAHAMDFILVDVTRGTATFQGAPSARMLNPLGTVHGGWFATLLDSALGCAVHTTMPAGRGYTTSQLNVNMIRAITPKVARVRAIGQVIHVGRQMATADARLVGPDGTLYAHATTTCLVFDLPPQSKA